MTKISRLVFVCFIACSLYFTAASQSLSVNTSGAVADPSAILDVSSTAKGMLIPRMTKAQKNAIATPATGLLIFQNAPDSTGFYYFNGSSWLWLTDAANADTTAWKITGNSNITSSRFLGTLNDSALRFRVRNIPSGIIDSASANTALGFKSLIGITTGVDNVAFGYQASFAADTASQITAIGSGAMIYNLKSENTAVGTYAARWGNFNPALTSLHPTRNTENTAIGFRAMNSNASGRKNVAVGYRALAIGPNNTYVYEIGSGPATLLSRNVAIGDSAMAVYTGSSGIAIGADAMSRAGFVLNNIAIGDSAMGNASTNSANENVAVGYKSLSQVRNQGNTATGAYSARNIGSGYWNTANGYQALENATTAAGNTVMGTSSFRTNVSGFDNVGVGINTGYHVTSGNNTYMGSYAGEGAAGFSTGGSNTGLGNFALADIRSGFSNTAVGRQALAADTSGSYNVAIGQNALLNNLASDFNTAVGFNSLIMHKRAGFTYNTAVGSNALEQDSSGFQNTGIGVSAFRFNKTGFYNTGVGINAGYYQKESYNTFIGAYSGVGERSSPAYVAADTGNYNTGLGAYSMWRIANGEYNVAIGYLALQNDSSGSYNTASGNLTLINNTTGSFNTGFGYSALSNNTTGNNNVAIGNNSDVSTGNLNNAAAIGNNAYVTQSNSMVLGGINGTNGALATSSVGIGTTAPGARLHVRRNGASGGTFIASSSMIIEDNTTSYLQFSNPNAFETGFLSGNASTNIRSAIVFRADSSIQLRSGGNINSITIDNTNFVGIGNVTPLDLLHVGTATGATVRIGSAETLEDFGATLLATNSNFVPTIDNVRTLGNTTNRWSAVWAVDGTINTSDARDKENINNLNYGLNEIMKLRPVSFTWKENPQWGKKIGFIAQEVKPILSEVVQEGELKMKQGTKNIDPENTITGKSDKLGIFYSDIIPVTVKAIQEQQQTIEQQQKQIEELKKKNDQLQKDIQAIKAKLGINN